VTDTNIVLKVSFPSRYMPFLFPWWRISPRSTMK
jgi:hypothetical protein